MFFKGLPNVKGLFLILSLFASAANAQDDPSDSYVQPKNEQQKNKQQKNRAEFASKLRYGGSFGAYFGRQTYIEVAPKVGYKFNQRLLVGLGFNYIYFSVNDYGQRYSTNIYGPNVFGQFALYSGLFAHAEFNAYNLSVYNNYPPYNASRIWIGSAPVGIGYYSGGQQGGVYLSLLYDLINNPHSPYYNPAMPLIIRVGFLF